MKYTIKILFFAVCCFTYSSVFSQSNLINAKAIIKNETKMNSEYLEFSPSFYKDGIVFISNRKAGLKYLRKDVSPENKTSSKFTTSIFESKRRDDGVQKESGVFAQDITTSYHEGPVTFSKDEKVIYFTRNSYIKRVKGKSKSGKTKNKIYRADRQGNYWVNEREVPNLNSDEFNTGYPTLSADGNKLYFASDRPGGQGGYDLYVSSKNGGSWGTPINLGPAINTPKTEAFPFIHKDGILFFASNGHHDDASRPDYDVLMVEKVEGSDDWTAPVNVEAVNTGSDDFGLILSPEKEYGFFASNRPHDDAKGEDDIYSFSIEGYLEVGAGEENSVEACPVKIVVVDEETGNVISDAKVDYTKLDAQDVINNMLSAGKAVVLDPVDGNSNEFNLKVVFDDEEVETGKTNSQGTLDGLNICEDQIFRVTKDGYRQEQIVYSPTKKDKDPVVKVVMKKLIEAINIDGAVVDRMTQRGISSPLVTILNETTGKRVDEFRADANGNFVFSGDCGNTYAITVKASNYRAVTEKVTLKPEDCWEKKKIELDFPLGSSLTGARIPLNVYYDFNDSQIRSDALNELDQIVGLLQKYSYLSVTLTSHTDTRGTNQYNQRLSERRANAAKQYMISRGVAASRISAIGYGESQPLENCGNNCTELQHQTNRRTTATISGGDIQQYNNRPENVDPGK